MKILALTLTGEYARSTSIGEYARKIIKWKFKMFLCVMRLMKNVHSFLQEKIVK